MLTDSNEFNSKLIDLVKECPEIYDKEHKGYKGEINQILKYYNIYLSF